MYYMSHGCDPLHSLSMGNNPNPQIASILSAYNYHLSLHSACHMLMLYRYIENVGKRNFLHQILHFARKGNALLECLPLSNQCLHHQSLQHWSQQVVQHVVSHLKISRTTLPVLCEIAKFVCVASSIQVVQILTKQIQPVAIPH